MMCQVHMSRYQPPDISGRLRWTRGHHVLMSRVIGETEGGGPTATSRLLNSLLAFIKALWLFHRAMMERCVTDAVSKWTVSHSLCVIAAKNNVSLYMDALPRQTEAPFNK